MADKRYRAFISYSQKDKAAGRRVQRWLATYQVPKGIDGARDRRPGRFFRDDEEMSASPDVGGLTGAAAANDAEGDVAGVHLQARAALSRSESRAAVAVT